MQLILFFFDTFATSETVQLIVLHKKKGADIASLIMTNITFLF